ncbi:RNA polymerase sigma factor [Chitinophaga horti]|uniref:RNA polymerase sigma factor n=1 Tax=Chitinophaga horti TaxID=2920382 RepID=A0ABY6J371_9BACT|nr:RNA polymerase sigma factor [Chitinophaga horti]UYQ94113.1 RNA polymerase sigma factor [Chitinophaga horti]
MIVQPLHNEPEMLKDMQEGDAAAFTALYRHYSPPIYTVTLRMVKDPGAAQEIIQDIFSDIWKNREVLEIENLAAYLYRAGQNRVLNFFKKLQHDRQRLEDFRVFAEEHYSHIEEALHYRESAEMLRDVLQDLSPKQRQVYELCRIEGRSYKEAAAIMGISSHTVKEYLVEANKRIRAGFGNNPALVFALLYLAAARPVFF